jgi:hypothetical protein
MEATNQLHSCRFPNPKDDMFIPKKDVVNDRGI